MEKGAKKEANVISYFLMTSEWHPCILCCKNKLFTYILQIFKKMHITQSYVWCSSFSINRTILIPMNAWHPIPNEPPTHRLPDQIKLPPPHPWPPLCNIGQLDPRLTSVMQPKYLIREGPSTQKTASRQLGETSKFPKVG